MQRHTLALLALGLAALPSAPARAAEGEASFTPTSFLMPIQGIFLANSTDLTVTAPIYSCTPRSRLAAPLADAGAGDDCVVDMADAAALARLFSAPADVHPGTYDSIVVSNCFDEGSFVAKLKGSVELEGGTYYTTSGTPVISTNPADLDYTSITYGGCAGGVKISPPITVKEGDSVTMNAFFTLKNLSWVLGNNSPGLGGCAVAPAHASNVCSGLPVLVSYVGTSAPSLESYYISEDPNDLDATKAAGQVMLLSTAGEPFGGFLRRVYSHASETPSVSYDVPLREVTKNAESGADAGAADAGSAAAADAGAQSADGGVPASYDVYAIGDPAQDTTKYRVRFPHFELRDHAGTLFTANGASTREYRAVKR